MRIMRQREQSRFAPLLKILVSLVVITGVSLSLAWAWHTTQLAEEQEIIAPASSEEEPPPSSREESSASSAAEEAPPEEPESEPESEPEPEAGAVGSGDSSSEGTANPDSGSETESPEEGAERQSPPGSAPESALVEDTYFDDAIFFGDSISTGIPLYHIADNAAVVAMTGINTSNINTKPCIDLNDGTGVRVTILEAAKQYGPRSKVYIMLGGNGLGFDKETFISGYREFLRSVKEMYPDAVIYLQSMTPVVEGYVNEFDPGLNNEKIDAYNLEILRLAQEENVYYLDVASAFKNADGALPLEASPVDGMHFTPEYYGKWFHYLKTHTVAVEGQE